MLRKDDIIARLDELVGPVDPEDPRGAKRLRLIQVATQLFSERGYRKTSIDDIAERAGIAKGTVYLHFKTKLDILMSAVALEKKKYLYRLEPIFDESLPARERLHHWLYSILTLGTEMPLTGRLMSGDMELLAVMQDLPPELVREQDQRRIEMMADLVDEAARPHTWTRHELEDRINVLSGFAHFAALIGHDYVRSGLSVERFAAILTDIVIAGLGRVGRLDEKGNVP